MTMGAEVSIRSFGANALLLQWPSEINSDILRQVVQLDRIITPQNINGVIESVPSYHSLAVYFDPSVINRDQLTHRIGHFLHSSETGPWKPRRWEIPICYHEDLALDVSDISNHSGLSFDEICAIHSGTEYQVYCIGFLPGFTYLGTVDPKIQIPRKASPRIQVPPGSVGIAGAQTGIYPSDSPGGWQIIGRSPMSLFDAGQSPPCEISPGDRVVFSPIHLDEFNQLSKPG